MPNANPGRETDDRDLLMLQMLRSGNPRPLVAEVTGMQVPYIGAVLGRVLRADLAESGEPQDLVRMAYLPLAHPKAKPLRGAFAGRY